MLPLLGTIFLIYRTNNAETLASSFDTARGLFQLRAGGACVIRLAAVQLEIPDHPLLGTIFLIYRTTNAEAMASSFERQEDYSSCAPAALA